MRAGRRARARSAWPLIPVALEVPALDSVLALLAVVWIALIAYETLVREYAEARAPACERR